METTSGKVTVPMIVIRGARIYDLPSIMKIEEMSFREKYPRGIFIVFLESNPDTFLVAEYGGRVVGYVMGYLKPDLEGHIMSIAVHPDYRGKGIGSALLAEVVERLFKLGARYIGLEVRVSNKRAIKLYERFGFRKIKLIPHYYADDEDAYYMLLSAKEWRGS